MKILVSACLLGENCKYNGGNNYRAHVCRLAREHELIPICPERAAGLGIPRTPIELRGGEAVDKNGNSVDAVLRCAVAQLMDHAAQEQIDLCILKSRSPTCGVHQVYDGSFCGRLVAGAGVLAQALIDAGYRVIEDEDLQKP